VEGLGGVGGCGGEVEFGAELEDFSEGDQGPLEGRTAEPAAEDGGGGPLLGGRAGGVLAEGAEKRVHGAGGAFDAWHIRASFISSYDILMPSWGLKKWYFLVPKWFLTGS
jgi:hypothetical protein